MPSSNKCRHRLYTGCTRSGLVTNVGPWTKCQGIGLGVAWSTHVHMDKKPPTNRWFLILDSRQSAWFQLNKSIECSLSQSTNTYSSDVCRYGQWQLAIYISWCQMNPRMIQRKRKVKKTLIMKLRITALNKRSCPTLNHTKETAEGNTEEAMGPGSMIDSIRKCRNDWEWMNHTMVLLLCSGKTLLHFLNLPIDE